MTNGDTSAGLDDPMIQSVREQANDLMPDTIALRRTLHEWPELGNDLPITREHVLASLEGLPLEVSTHESTSGIVAMLEGSTPGPTMLLRGDMDALPMPEDTGLEFSSHVDGCMHACGHDTHTAMLSSAAKLLSTRRDEIAGRVLFMFQPGEEGHHGAQFMLDEGLLDVPDLSDGSSSPVDAAFALHITSALPSGWVSTRGGPIMASADTLSIKVIGRGGHASEPHRALDPIPVACEIVQALQTMITRSIDVFDPAVVTVGRITAGTTSNVIPEVAEIDGTIRAVSERSRTKVHDGIKRVAEGIAAAHGCGCEVEVGIGYPVTTNDDEFAEFAFGMATDVVGKDAVVRLPHPVMGAEDFSYVLNNLPGAMMFLGGTPLDRNLATAAPNHSNRVYFDESAMSVGTSLYATAALRHLTPA
ncbi:MAG: amidohydrolase [Actinobacteria bacterium]|nr:MAG: amidohydrolase [Actinomycetota bacterium]